MLVVLVAFIAHPIGVVGVAWGHPPKHLQLATKYEP